MKKIKIIVLLALALPFYSCEDFLSPDPISSLVADTYYANEEELLTGVINMYDGIQGLNSTSANDYHGIQVEYLVTEMRSDNTRSKSGEGETAQFEMYAVESTNGVVADYYRSFYNVVYRANIVLDNLDAASDATRGAFEGEARFVRGYAFFNLVRLFGAIPLPLGPIGPDDAVTAYTRVPVDEVYDQIKSDMNSAIDNLDNTYKNRASRAAAQVLLAKVHLGLGEYTEARALIEAVMAANYSLVEDFQDIFYDENNSEIIFAIGFVGDNERDSQNFSAEWLNSVGRSSGLNYVTVDVRNAFAEFGGQERSDYSVRNDAEQTSQYQVVKYLPNGDTNLGILPTSSDPTLAGNDWIVLRYGDVLLLHVEAILAGNDLTTSNAAIASFQAIRDRAGLTDIVTEITKEDLLNERRVELAFENHRLFDLIRMGEAENVLRPYAEALDFSFSIADLLLPIPLREVSLSGGIMEQNPGY